MKLYFWDWESSGRIEVGEFEEFPFHSKEYAEKQDCYTNLKDAKKAAITEITNKIEYLKEQLTGVKNTTPVNADKRHYV